MTSEKERLTMKGLTVALKALGVDETYWSHDNLELGSLTMKSSGAFLSSNYYRRVGQCRHVLLSPIQVVANLLRITVTVYNLASLTQASYVVESLHNSLLDARYRLQSHNLVVQPHMTSMAVNKCANVTLSSESKTQYTTITGELVVYLGLSNNDESGRNSNTRATARENKNRERSKRKSMAPSNARARKRQEKLNM